MFFYRLRLYERDRIEYFFLLTKLFLLFILFYLTYYKSLYSSDELLESEEDEDEEEEDGVNDIDTDCFLYFSPI